MRHAWRTSIRQTVSSWYYQPSSTLFACLPSSLRAMSGRLSSKIFGFQFLVSLECLLNRLNLQLFHCWPGLQSFRTVQTAELCGHLRRSSAATERDENRDFNLKQFSWNRVDKANLAKQLKRFLLRRTNSSISTDKYRWSAARASLQIVRSRFTRSTRRGLRLGNKNELIRFCYCS